MNSCASSFVPVRAAELSEFSWRLEIYNKKPALQSGSEVFERHGYLQRVRRLKDATVGNVRSVAANLIIFFKLSHSFTNL